MTALPTAADRGAPDFTRKREAMLELIGQLDEVLEDVRAGGGERYTRRHRERGKLLPRERIELLLDRDSAFLELSPFAAYDTQFKTGASVITGIGVVEGVECVISASEATVKGGSQNPYSFRRGIRAMEVARVNRLPYISLTESGGADLPTQAEVFVPGGGGFRRQADLLADGTRDGLKNEKFAGLARNHEQPAIR